MIFTFFLIWKKTKKTYIVPIKNIYTNLETIILGILLICIWSHWSNPISICISFLTFSSGTSTYTSKYPVWNPEQFVYFKREKMYLLFCSSHIFVFDFLFFLYFGHLFCLFTFYKNTHFARQDGRNGKKMEHILKKIMQLKLRKRWPKYEKNKKKTRNRHISKRYQVRTQKTINFIPTRFFS